MSGYSQNEVSGSSPEKKHPPISNGFSPDSTAKPKKTKRPSIFAWPFLAVIYVYRYTLSPYFGNACRFEPTCSRYAEEALRKYGAWKGSIMAAKRMLRCHPWGGAGYDPVR